MRDRTEGKNVYAIRRLLLQSPSRRPELPEYGLRKARTAQALLPSDTSYQMRRLASARHTIMHPKTLA